MENSARSDILICIMLTVSLALVAFLRFKKGESTEGILWSIASLAALLKTMIAVKNRDHQNKNNLFLTRYS